MNIIHWTLLALYLFPRRIFSGNIETFPKHITEISKYLRSSLTYEPQLASSGSVTGYYSLEHYSGVGCEGKLVYTEGYPTGVCLPTIDPITGIENGRSMVVLCVASGNTYSFLCLKLLRRSLVQVNPQPFLLICELGLYITTEFYSTPDCSGETSQIYMYPMKTCALFELSFGYKSVKPTCTSETAKLPLVDDAVVLRYAMQ